MISIAFAAFVGAICLPATYSISRGGSIPVALLVVVFLGALGGAIAVAVRRKQLVPKTRLLVLAFIAGAALSEIAAFVRYYITFGYSDPKLAAGVGVSVIEFGVISIIGSAAFAIGAAVAQSRITRRSRGRAASGAPLS